MRALLRQTTYLPDSAAREFFHHHIVDSFRHYCPRTPKQSDGTLIKKPWLAARFQQRMKDARKGWRTLVRANHGSRKHLRQVLEMAYGRRGKQKYNLMRDVVPPELSQDSKALEELSLIIEDRHKNLESKEPRLSEKLSALIRAQRFQKDSLFAKKNIRSAEPSIPEQNIWLRPFPKKREKNIRKQWYAETMDRLMPPLPEADWNRLKDLSSGRLSWEGPRPPRQRAEGQYMTDEYGSDWDSDSHELTPRYMRHMWENVFVQCPMMWWHTERQRWWVSWGRPQTETAVSIGADFDCLDDGAFEGVDAEGKLK
ncbi:MAG: hypothetical protein Q9191_002435 [Dirinaria sp. TL-2023a]